MPSASSTQPPNIRPPPISESQEFVPEKPAKTPDIINDGQLSFRGVPLEPERYSVRCGLEGVYLPGKRWRRKVEIIQPIEVHSFAAKCTSENLLCVLIKVTRTSLTINISYLEKLSNLMLLSSNFRIFLHSM
jgi:hypothetical protein